MKNILLIFGLLILSNIAFSQGEGEEKYGSNLITVSPFHGYASPQISDVAIGLGYERFVNNFLGLKIPLNLGIINNMVQSGISAKFYPFGHDRPVKYAIAPTFMFTHASKENSTVVWDPNTQTSFERLEQEVINQVGFLLNSSLNITIEEKIYIGMETGLGLNYLNRITRDGVVDNNNNGPNVAFLFNIGMGYRF